MRRSGPRVVTFLLLGAVFLGTPLAHGQEAAGDTVTPPSGNPGQRRDPFRPFTLDVHLRPDRSAQLTPLQRYDLGQLTVVATVWELSPPRAMVEDSVGMGYIVTLGTPIGRNRGLVAAIEPQRVVVEEHVLDFYGREQVNRIIMETPKEEGPSRSVREQK